MARNNNTRGPARTANEDLSLTDKLKFVMNQLQTRRSEIEAVLPCDLSFDSFHATVNQALRNNPKVLEATGISIVNACVKAAYDGLRPDGKEAAIVTHSVKVSKNPDRYETQAQYFPMAFGLVQQILRGGEVIAVEVDIIYEKEEYQIRRGTNSGIHHVPMMVGDRGRPIAAYSVATLKSGHTTFIVMREDEILDIQRESKTGWYQGEPAGVWKRWPMEMWKKTVIRRHRKTLPLGNRVIVDIEAREEFPQFQAGAGQQALGAPPPMPQRTALEHHQTLGQSLDFGNQPEPDGVVVEQRAAAEQARKPAVRKQDDTRAADIPEDDQAWMAWVGTIERKIAAADTPAAVNLIAAAEELRIRAAAPSRGNWIRGVISDRLADLAAGVDGKPQAGDEDHAGQQE
jgi:recombination protein RecT